MSDFSRFRSAFNGFSRTDVVNYIEETSAAHQKAIEQLEGEKQQLMQENAHLLAENARLTTELADLKAAQEKLKEEDLPFLCESAAADACAPGNPRPASLEQFEEMFRKLM